MSTQASNALSRDNPKDRIVIRVNAKDWYDAANQRGKSGYIALSITGLTWTPTTPGGSEKLRVVTRAYHDNPDNNDRTENVYTVGSGGPGSLSLTLNTAVNYGTFGPSALVEEDGTVSLFVIDLSLEDFDLTGKTDVTGLVATATYTATPVVIDAYSALPSANSNASHLKVHEKCSGDWCPVVAQDLATNSPNAIAVQLSGLTVTLTDFAVKGGPAPRFRLLTAPQNGGGQSLADFAVSKAPSSAPAPVYPPTWVYAVNNGKPDAHASRINLQVCTSGVEVVTFCVANVGLVKPFPTDDTVAVTANLLFKNY